MMQSTAAVIVNKEWLNEGLDHVSTMIELEECLCEGLEQDCFFCVLSRWFDSAPPEVVAL